MKIISNDYLSNLPGEKKLIKGGPPTFARAFSSELLKRGHEWVGVVGKYDGKTLKQKIVRDKKNKRKWYVFSLPNDFISKNFSMLKKYKNPVLSCAPAIKEMEKMIIEEKPDVVFINGINCFVWTYLRAARNVGVPIVVLYAGIWNKEIDMYAHLYTKNGVRVMKSLEKDFSSLSRVNIFLNETSKNVFRKVVCRTPESKAEIIPLACEFGGNKNAKKGNGTEKKDFNVGIVARWDRIKNHAAFLALAKESAARGKNWKFYAVTTIPETGKFKEFKDDYRKNIKVLPLKKPENLRKFYQKMDIMVLPSLFDVSPHVVLEAAFEGTPTFISKNVGHADFFKKNGMGEFIVDFRDPRKALSIIENVIKGKRKGKYPAKFVELLKKRHDPSRVFSQIISVFEKVSKQNKLKK